MVLKKSILAVAVPALMLLTQACSNCNESLLQGCWTQPVPGISEMEQGICFYEGGKAGLVNMHTLRYETWSIEDSCLILTGHSLGNGQTIAFSDTFSITVLTEDSLVLQKGDFLSSYHKRTEGNSGCGVVAGAYVDSVEIDVAGTLVIGHELREFTPLEDTAAYWIVDSTGKLYRMYDSVTGGVKNGVPAYVEMRVVDKGKSCDGYSIDYKSVYSVCSVDTICLQ